ncbi:hypothetical protein TNCV_2697881 [Trichonephila clavipes]|nr:hypothetical protein TNCV_2697881 [Trichonephila clavipes]
MDINGCSLSDRMLTYLSQLYQDPISRPIPSHELEQSPVDIYTRAFGDGPRNFEPWSSDDETHQTRQHVSSHQQSNVC